MWLPPSLADEQNRERAAMQDMFDVYQAVEHFNPQLHSIDPGLELVKAKDGADQVSVPGLKPGYWHLVRREGMDATILPLEYPNGDFREPGSWMYDYLQEQDMWNDRAQAASRKRVIQAAKDQERDQELKREQRVDEINDRVRSMNSTQILVP